MFPIEQADQLIQDFLNQFCHSELYRLIDVDNMVVYDYHEGTLTTENESCYKVWKRTSPCINCISKRAVDQGSHFIKMDVVDDQVFLICAVPIRIKGRNMSLETIWNVTDNLMAEVKAGENILFRDLINQINLAVVRDPYTGLYNKCHAEHELQNFVLRWREDWPLVVIMLDIDWFKEVNDRHGHIQGDLVIKTLADILTEWADPLSGTACRVGGDEFLVIFKGTALENMKHMIEQLEQTVSEYSFGQDSTFHVSVSVGAAEYSPDMGTWKALVEKADQMMYRKKKDKRGNRADTEHL